MDAEAKALQERLHQANEKRWDGVERNIGELKTEVREIRDNRTEDRETLATIAANTACVPDLIKRVNDLESSRDRQRGALSFIGIVQGALTLWATVHR